MSGSEWRLRLSRTLPSRCCQLDVPTRPQPDGPCHPPGPVTAPSSLPGPPQPEEASQSLDVIGRCPWENLPKAPHCNWNKRRNFYRGDKAILGFSLSFISMSPLFLNQDLCTCCFPCSELFPRPVSPHCSSLRSNLTSQKGLPYVVPAAVARPPPSPSVTPPCV